MKSYDNTIKYYELLMFYEDTSIDKEDWIVTENHHEAIISKEKFDRVQDILDRQTKVNKDGSIDILSGF